MPLPKLTLKTFALLLLLLITTSGHSQNIGLGSKVEVQWQSGSWYPATVIDSSATQLKVHLDGDGDNNSRDQWITKNKGLLRLAKAGTVPAAPAPVTQTKAKAGTVPVVTAPVAQTKTPTATEKGKRVEVNETGHWYKATVLEQKGDLYKVHFDGYTAADDKWVHRSYTRDLAENDVPVTATCSFMPPPGEFTDASPASDALFKREVYDWYNRLANGTLTRPTRIGVVFTSFQRGTAYKNTVENVPGVGATRKHSGAPANNMIYPVRMTYHVCEDYNGDVSQKQVNADFSFFVNKDGQWTCSKDN